MKYPIVWEFPTQIGKQGFRRHDGDENERKSNRLNRQNKKGARTSRFFFFQLYFFAVTTRFRTFYGGRKQVTTKFFSLSELQWGCQEFGSKRVRLHLTKNASWNNPDRDWKNANSLFKWRFRCRRLKSQFYQILLSDWAMSSPGWTIMHALLSL